MVRRFGVGKQCSDRIVAQSATKLNDKVSEVLKLDFDVDRKASAKLLASLNEASSVPRSATFPSEAKPAFAKLASSLETRLQSVSTSWR